MSTISGVSGSSNAWATLNTQRSQHQAKMFAKVDTDASGGIDQTELNSMLNDISKKTGISLGDSKELFSKMDSNADGSLSSDELDQGMKAMMPPPPSTMDFAQSRGTGSDGPQDDLFSKIDTDSDGSVSKDELQALTDKMKADTGRDVSQDFSKLDTDGDGTLSQTEFEAGRPQPPEGANSAQQGSAPGGPGKADGPAGPPPGAAGAKSASSDSTTYDPLDTNKDGVVSELERLVGQLQSASSELGSSDKANNVAANLDVATLAKQIYAQIAAGLSESQGGLLNASA